MIKTKQELLNHFSDINTMYNNPFMYQTLSNMIDELLEQVKKETYIQGYDYGVKDWFKAKTEPCEDCISGESVIEWLKDKDIIKTKNQEENARRELGELPSAQPQPKPKNGKWRKEWLTDSMTGRDGIYRVCSECGYEEDYYSGRKLDYCPRCGSRNKEGVNE